MAGHLFWVQAKCRFDSYRSDKVAGSNPATPI